jgi:predicted nucleic acid-binding protein
MNPYADSSFLVSCYVADANTPQAQAYLSVHPVPLIFTALHGLEVRNALKLGVFRGLFAAKTAAAAWANVEIDLRAGRLVRTTVEWPVAWRVAAQLSEKHTIRSGTRSLDVLHVAVAKSIRALEFISFDSRQCTLAAMVGLQVSP